MEPSTNTETKSEPKIESSEPKIDTTQQATTLKPPKPEKNPKKVAAGVASALKTKEVKEQQKIKMKEMEEKMKEYEKEKMNKPSKNEGSNYGQKLSVNQWLSLGGLVVSALGLYFRFEDVKAFFQKDPPPAPKKQPIPLQNKKMN